jgi:hypothetical protein
MVLSAFSDLADTIYQRNENAAKQSNFKKLHTILNISIEMRTPSLLLIKLKHKFNTLYYWTNIS